MKEEIKYVLYLVSLGAALVAYAHSTFATKDYVQLIHEDVKEIKKDVKIMLTKGK